MDSTSQHKTGYVKNFESEYSDTVMVMYLRVRTPELSVIQGADTAKSYVLVSEHCATFGRWVDTVLIPENVGS